MSMFIDHISRSGTRVMTNVYKSVTREPECLCPLLLAAGLRNTWPGGPLHVGGPVHANRNRLHFVSIDCLNTIPFHTKDRTTVVFSMLAKCSEYYIKSKACTCFHSRLKVIFLLFVWVNLLFQPSKCIWDINYVFIFVKLMSSSRPVHIDHPWNVFHIN